MRVHDASETDVPLRVGFTVSRKVGNAVVRNRVRRRLRVVADNLLPKFAPQDRDYVIIGRHNAYKRSFSSLTEDLERALKKMRAHKVAEISS